MQLWNLGTARLKGLVENLSKKTRQQLTCLLTLYRKTKESLDASAAEADAASVCRDCRGQCCLNGKYRINVIDVLARMTAEITTTVDFSRKPVCPYGTEDGCGMEPGLRPADCVLFICDAIDRKLSPLSRSLLAEQEMLLRECIHDASLLTGEELQTPLLLWAATKKTNPIC